MSQFGIAQAKPAVASQSEGERFKAPRPVFQAPKNANSLQAMTPKAKDSSPAPSLASRASTTENAAVKAALLAASKAAKTDIPEENGISRVRTIKVEPKAETPKADSRPKFGPEDVCDDASFIKRTIRGQLHDAEYIRLFWANGGERHMVSGLTYAQAFHNLRQEKIRNLRKK